MLAVQRAGSHIIAKAEAGAIAITAPFANGAHFKHLTEQGRNGALHRNGKDKTMVKGESGPPKVLRGRIANVW